MNIVFRCNLRVYGYFSGAGKCVGSMSDVF